MKDRMQNNEIIKDLRSIVGKYNLYQKDWQTIEFAISEIHHLQAENEQLKVEIERFKKIETTVNGFWDEIPKLGIAKGKEKPTLEELLEYFEKVKEEAVKEFAERLKETALGLVIGEKYECKVVTVEGIDNIAKEMGCE